MLSQILNVGPSEEENYEHICRFCRRDWTTSVNRNHRGRSPGIAQPEPATWDTDSFAEEQIRGLVRQVFLPGWPKPAHQVVFSPVDPETDVSTICMQVGLALSTQVSGTTCLVEANPSSSGLEQLLENNGLDLVAKQESSALRDSSHRVSNELWLVPRRVFLAESENAWSGPWLRDRLADLPRRSTTPYFAGRLRTAVRQRCWPAFVSGFGFAGELDPARYCTKGEGTIALSQGAFAGGGT
jgi:hypothetical protein